ncbi:unannotated protein [freshwater metagenome]|uniref:Unannotated protein n=1 Tax=freshwater metagenome TaxID=449393 RepID=A0A6J7VIU6_9ZZZZ
MAKQFHRTIVAVTEIATEGNDREQQKRRNNSKERRKDEDASFRPVGNEIFFEKELDAIGECLKDAKWTSRIRTNTILKVANDLSFEPNHEHGRHQKERKDGDDLEQDNKYDSEIDMSRKKRITTKHLRHLH